MLNNPKILIISAVFPPEPVISAKLSLDIANELSKSNYVYVITPPPTRPFGFNFKMKQNTNYNFKHETLNSYGSPKFSFLGRLFESISFGIECYKYIKINRNNIDIIYSSTWPIFAQFLNVFAANKYKIPIIIHIQDVYPESLLTKKHNFKKLIQFILKIFDNYSFKKSKKIIAISSKMKSFLLNQRDVDSTKIIVVENWYTNVISVKSIISNKKEQDFIYMYLGNIGPLAGLDHIIDFFNYANIPNTKLIIAGDGSIKSTLVAKVKFLNNTNIEFLEVPEGQVEVIQNQADILLLPLKKNANNTSIPSKLPAYMFSSKPILACVDLQSDIAECIIESNSGWVITSEDKSSFVNVLREISKTTQFELQIKGENGYKYATKRFSKESNLPKLLNTILN